MAPVQRKLRKALGAVKDQTSIGLAKVASSRAPDLDVAVLKATSHAESPIDEKYVYELLHYMSFSRAYVAACVSAIAKRLNKTRNWIVALKALMLVHRLLRDGDPSFEEELSFAAQRGLNILNLSGFRDQSSSSAWDYSAFVRTYSLYLDERLRSFSAKVQDNNKRAHEAGRRLNGYSDSSGVDAPEDPHSGKKEQAVASKDMKPDALLLKLPDLQQLLERVIGCRPTGAARNNRLVQVALYPVVTESSQIYADVFDGVTVLLNAFFDLEYSDSVKALEVYKTSAKQAGNISAFYGLCKNIGIGRPVDYPNVQSVSQEHVDTLEDYVRGLPKGTRRQRSASPEPMPLKPGSSLSKQEIAGKPDIGKPPERKPLEVSSRSVDADEGKTADLLNISEPVVAPEDTLALALFSGTSTDSAPKWEPFGPSTQTNADPPNATPSPQPAQSEAGVDGGKAGWELALVQESTNIRAAIKTQMAGGFDNLLLDSMYDQGAVIQTTALASLVGGSASSVALQKQAPSFLALPAPPGAASQLPAGDPFAASAAVPPPAYVQMADLTLKQRSLQQEQLEWQRYQMEGMQGYHGFMKANNNPYMMPIGPGFNNFTAFSSAQMQGPYAQHR